MNMHEIPLGNNKLYISYNVGMLR